MAVSRGLLPLAVAVALAGAVFFTIAALAVTEATAPNAADGQYNLLVAGFRHGQLNLDKKVPQKLAELADPYDPAANGALRVGPTGVHDLSYFQGKLYLYFGPTPAMLLFWPWRVITGHYIPQRMAVAVFWFAGFLLATGILHGAWRRYFPEVAPWVLAAGVAALALAGGGPILLERAEVWEVPVGCGFALLMAALAAIWRALHEPARRPWWIAAASLAVGLAVGARPSLLFCAVVLLVPLFAGRQPEAGASEGRWRDWLAAVLPLAVCGAGLMLYNWQRFGTPWEFGQRFQLAGDRQNLPGHFSLRYFWFNGFAYFFAPSFWREQFPFVGGIWVPRMPPGHAPIEDPFGLFSNLPMLWMAFAVPFCWNGLRSVMAGRLRAFVLAVALAAASAAAVLLVFYGTCCRYEMDFLPFLMLLAVLGILAAEKAVGGRSRRLRVAVRTGWILLCVLSIGFSFLSSVGRYAEQRALYAALFIRQGRIAEALPMLEHAIRLNPYSSKAENEIGSALWLTGRHAEAPSHFAKAAELNPDFLEARLNLGLTLIHAQQYAEAAAQYHEAVRIDPHAAAGHYGLGLTLSLLGRLAESETSFRKCIRIDPQLADAHKGLGIVLTVLNRHDEAKRELREAERLEAVSGQ